LYYNTETGFAANSTMVCAERIQDVQLRGHNEAAKIFVTIERRFTRLDTLMAKHKKPLADISKDMVRRMGPHWHFQQQLKGEEWGDAVLKEYRNLVFLKERTPAELSAIEAGQTASLKYMKCTFSTLPLRFEINLFQLLVNRTFRIHSHLHAPSSSDTLPSLLTRILFTSTRTMPKVLRATAICSFTARCP
jgi:hypothetical protein